MSFQFASHRQAIKEGNTDKAIQSFIMLYVCLVILLSLPLSYASCSQTNSAQHKTFQTYLIELADHIDPTTDSDMSRTLLSFYISIVINHVSLGFFGSLPALIQSSIVESAAGKHLPYLFVFSTVSSILTLCKPISKRSTVYAPSKFSLTISKAIHVMHTSIW